MTTECQSCGQDQSHPHGPCGAECQSCGQDQSHPYGPCGVAR